MTVSLSQLIDEVREELLQPPRIDKAEALYPFLFVDEVQIEVGVKVSGGADASGKVSIKVVEVGVGANLQNEDVHRITVKLTPLYTKEEIRKRLEEQLGPRGTERAQTAGVRGTTKDLFSSES